MDSTDSKLEYPNLRNTSVVDSVQNWITDQIIKGNLRPGDKLPTESELCQNLGAGRNSVREAIKKLEAYGVVYIKRAEGTFVCENYNQNMLDPMLYNIILRKNNWSDFVDMRRTIDIGTLYVVMRKIKDGSELEPVRRALKELGDAGIEKARQRGSDNGRRLQLSQRRHCHEQQSPADNPYRLHKQNNRSQPRGNRQSRDGAGRDGTLCGTPPSVAVGDGAGCL
jgi:DNA-binding FadR family transcriptional regulator